LELNLALARELGAEVVVTHDEDVAEALVRVAIQHNATQIVVGEPCTPRLLDVVRGGNLVNRLLRLRGSIDIHVVSAGRRVRQEQCALGMATAEASPVHEYVEVAGVLGVLTAMSWSLAPVPGYYSVGIALFARNIALSLRVDDGPCWWRHHQRAALEFSLYPPRFTFLLRTSRTA
jgi:two-component system sensor histidine kinase KdpD